MNRRQLLTMIAAVTGTAMIGGHRAFAYLPTETGQNIFSPEDTAFLDEVAEVILPATDTPGAKDAAVGAFMTQFVSDCFDEADQQAFRDSIATLRLTAQDSYGKPFEDLTPDERRSMLQSASDAALAQATIVKEYEATRDPAVDIQPAAAAVPDIDPDAPLPHWFTAIQQLVLFGFFTSEVGATQVLRYDPVPGAYDGDLAYDGGPAWAT